MLDAKQKLDYLARVQKQLGESIFNCDLEVRMWERKKVTAKDSVLLTIENMIKAQKVDKGLFIEKLDIVEEEIKKYEKELAGK